MNPHESTSQQEDVEITNLRARIREVIESRDGEDSYVERLREAFEYLQYSISSTVGKVEGGDIISVDDIPPERLKALRRDVDEFKKLLL